MSRRLKVGESRLESTRSAELDNDGDDDDDANIDIHWREARAPCLLCGLIRVLFTVNIRANLSYSKNNSES